MKKPGRSYQTGTVLKVPTEDFRSESDPERRFTKLWQQEFAGYGLVRDAATNALAMKDPLDGISFDRTAPVDSAPRPRERAAYIDANLGDFQGKYPGYGYFEKDLRQDVSSAGSWIADNIRDGEDGQVLYRGGRFPMDMILKWEKAALGRGPSEDGLITLGPSPVSTDAKLADVYINNRQRPNGEPINFVFDETTKSFNMSPHSAWMDSSPELILAGKFQVTKVELGHGLSPTSYVHLTPLEQPSHGIPFPS